MASRGGNPEEPEGGVPYFVHTKCGMVGQNSRSGLQGPDRWVSSAAYERLLAELAALREKVAELEAGMEAGDRMLSQAGRALERAEAQVARQEQLRVEAEALVYELKTEILLIRAETVTVTDPEGAQAEVMRDQIELIRSLRVDLALAHSKIRDATRDETEGGGR